MKRKYVVVALVALLLQSFAGLNATAAATKTQAEQDAQLLEEVKVKVARLGVGERARVTVRFKDGTKLKGYISQAKDSEFVVRDRKTDTPSVVLYRDVARVDSNRGHSTARNVALGTAIGVGSVLTVLAILISTLDD
jgi:cell division septal protein FtsQ